MGHGWNGQALYLFNRLFRALLNKQLISITKILKVFYIFVLSKNQRHTHKHIIHKPKAGLKSFSLGSPQSNFTIKLTKY